MNPSDFAEIMDRITISDRDKQRILENCIQEKHPQNKLFLYSKQLAAACAALAVLLTSLTAYAAVNAYQNYMSKMSAEEIEARCTELQQGEHPADRFSRALSDSERERLQTLTAAYQAGERFPQESMPRIGGSLANAAPTDLPVYDYENALFHLPERELSDEELLQIVDVWEKANYSLRAENDPGLYTDGSAAGEDPAAVKEFMEQYTEKADLSEEEKIQLFLEKFVEQESASDVPGNAAGTGFEWSISLYGEHRLQYWAVTENEREKYSVFFTPDSTPDDLRIQSFRHSSKTDETKPSESEQSPEKMRETLSAAAASLPALMRDFMGIDEAMVKAELHRGIYLILTDEADNRYRICINPRTGWVTEFLTYEAGQYDDVDLGGELLMRY